MNEVILKANELFKNCGFPYYFCGGFALDIFAGKTLRKHSDLDISTFTEYKRDIVKLLKGDNWDMYKRVFEPGGHGALTSLADENDPKMDDARVIWAMKPGSPLGLVPREGETDLYNFVIAADNQTDFNFVEVVLDSRDGNNFILSKGKSIMRAMDKAILFKDGVPFLAPEVVMFLKSPQVYFTHEFHKNKTPFDFKTIIPMLPAEGKQWLLSQLGAAYPNGHEWLDEYLT